MKKLYVLIGFCFVILQTGTATAMMAGLNKIMSSTYQKYLKRKPAPYTFYAPRDSYSYFSPHFNMYHYVGVDYTSFNDVTTDYIKNDLAAGVRGFKFKIQGISESGEIAYINPPKHARTTLTAVINEITTFAYKNNEIIIIHLNGTRITHNIITANIKSNTKFLFTPADRLKDIDNNAAKKRIIDTANNNALTVWPRLKWNYANKKLVMITWDSKNDSDYCWSYDTYFTNNLSDSKKLIESSVDSIRASMPVATVEHPTIFYSDVLKAELVSSLSFITLLAINMLTSYLYSIYSQPVSYQPAWDPMDWINNPDIIPANARSTFDTMLAKVKTYGIDNPKNPFNLSDMSLYDLRMKLYENFTPKRVYTYYPPRFLSLWTLLITSIGTSLTALGIYAIRHTKNAFTVVKKEIIPANMAVTGVFIKQPLSRGDAINISENKSPIFNAVSKLNRDDYTLINKFQRSLLMQVAHHGRRVVSPITNRMRKKR